MDGVRVSFENSTVCRACLFGLVVLCQFDVLLFFLRPRPWGEGFEGQFLLESLILAQDERWRRA